MESAKRHSEHGQSSSVDSGYKKAEDVFAEYGKFILSVIQSKVKDPEVVDDLFQDIFLSLVRKPLSSEIKNIKAYLYRLISNDFIDYIRRTKYKKLEIRYDELQHVFAEDSEAEKKLSNNEQVVRIFKLIDQKLPNSESTAIKLRYKEGRDVAGVAECMNITKRSAARYVSVGMRTVREYVASQEEDNHDA